MTNVNPYQQYRQNAVMSAGSGELTLMLYNGAVKFIKQGAKFIEEKDLERAHEAIVRAQEIILHLNDTLNMDFELSKSLALLYDYMHHRLLEANIKKEKDILGEVLGFVEELRDAWMEALKLSKSAMASGQ